MNIGGKTGPNQKTGLILENKLRTPGGEAGGGWGPGGGGSGRVMNDYTVLLELTLHRILTNWHLDKNLEKKKKKKKENLVVKLDTWPLRVTVGNNHNNTYFVLRSQDIKEGRKR